MRRAAEHQELVREVALPPRARSTALRPRAELIGESAAIGARAAAGRRRSRRPTLTVLITGESGTGKELVAAEIHRQSRRAPSELRAGQLRGHHRDAVRERVLRPPPRRVHRRDRRPRGRVRGGRGRHAGARRDRRPEAGRCRRSSCACWRAASTRSSASRARAAADVRVRRDHQRGPAARVQDGRLPQRPLLPAERVPDRACRRCASQGATSPSSRSTSSRRAAARRLGSPAAPASRSTRTSLAVLASLRLAGQRARAAQRDRARLDPRRGGRPMPRRLLRTHPRRGAGRRRPTTREDLQHPQALDALERRARARAPLERSGGARSDAARAARASTPRTSATTCEARVREGGGEVADRR